MDAPDPFVCVVPNTAEPLGSLRSNWESIVGEAFRYYDSSAVAEVAATVPIALNIGLIELHILTVQAVEVSRLGIMRVHTHRVAIDLVNWPFFLNLDALYAYCKAKGLVFTKTVLVMKYS